MANMSEDALFKALLKNKPPQQPPKPPVAQSVPRKEVPGPSPAAQPVERYQHEEPQPQIERITPVAKPVNLEPVVDSINRLNSSVNIIYGLMKNVIVPVLILTLVISIAIFIKSR
ncbi:MAG: hypothetical protein MPEBLZ_00652 [Candidatus Methanoperedens nitroreducens]|uniref:Uncharacterized protein n=1 Tax=Candidatus Methanoperedens nitratireducens TaxID=1392998 RepID=A0A0P7ZIB2_9EURY|nr:hypothetical protein [Candidatus Methanoperedens sp. BLZ2]KPQ44766.1 MAG: hypothetical protein MPEBLZ_00652 [Candidatus Methanoperedens sp. BLZ1]MBZ0176275.1 hypothetical protein [Candidatus Methanoperedens nitroreducens]MCX9077208.1 hypothetical protein [Candidatus Methanoperedens sp.]